MTGIPAKTEKKERLVERMRYDTPFFLRKVLPDYFPSPIMSWQIDALSMIESGYPRVAIMFPRDHGKTTLITYGLTVKKIAFRQARLSVVISESFDQSALYLETIKSIFEDERFQYYFGDLRDPKCWSSSDLGFNNGSRLFPRGSGQRIRGTNWKGRRLDWCVADDFESEQNTLTKEARAKLVRWMYGSVEPTVKKATAWDKTSGQLVAIGTIAHFESFLWKVRKNKHWRHMLLQIEQDGKFLWPEKFDAEFLEGKREEAIEMGALDDFHREYYNRPFNPETEFFNADTDIKYYDVKVEKIAGRWCLVYENKPIPMAVYITVDPALGKKKSDDSVITVGGMTPQRHLYTLEMIHGKIPIEHLLTHVLDLAEKWRPRKIGVEEASMQSVIITWLQKEKKDRGITIPVVGITTGGRSKTERYQENIIGLRPYFKSGKIHIRREHTIIRDEMVDFRPDKRDNKDNALDTLQMLLQLARPASDDLVETRKEREAAQSPIPVWGIL